MIDPLLEVLLVGLAEEGQELRGSDRVAGEPRMTAERRSFAPKSDGYLAAPPDLAMPSRRVKRLPITGQAAIRQNAVAVESGRD